MVSSLLLKQTDSFFRPVHFAKLKAAEFDRTSINIRRKLTKWVQNF